MVPHDATPQEFASVIIETINLHQDWAEDIQENNRKLLQHFERERVALQYLSLANNQPTGFYNKLETGIVSDNVVKKTNEVMTDFFKLSTVV